MDAADRWLAKQSGQNLFKKHKVRSNNSAHGMVDKEKWLLTQREYLRWRKTPEFTKWRKKQFLRQGGTCYYCDLPIYGGVRQNVEHVIPKIRGGDNRKSNLVLACAKCNKEKYTDYLGFKKRKDLKAKNKKKRGTYTQLKELYPTEYDIAMKIRDQMRED